MHVTLAGDIGGTKSLLALFADGSACFERRYTSREFAMFDALLLRFLADAREALSGTPIIRAACFGVAGPVHEDHVQLTNLPWRIERNALCSRLQVPEIRLLNDFAAAAWGIRQLQPGDFETLQEGLVVRSAPRVVLGAGTGLGIAYVIGQEDPVAGEGGHAGFAPATELQMALWYYLRARVGRVEWEHVVSGPGLLRIYAFLKERGDTAESAQLRACLNATNDPAVISRFAIEYGDPLAAAALDLFLACYGAVAGDHGLNVMARGGVFIAGGIAPKVLPRLRRGGFTAAFNDKGEFSREARRMPLHVTTNDRLGLIGAAAAVQATLTRC